MSGFTVVELLVVVVIITVLISAVLVASTTLMNRAKISNTRAMLAVVRDAVEQFQREQTGNPTIARNAAYRSRFGAFPPDEIEVFCTPNPLKSRLPEWPPNALAVGGAQIVPVPPGQDRYNPMKFYTKGLPFADVPFEHRDLTAMIVAIEMLGDVSSSILERVQDRYWSQGVIDYSNDPPEPALFLDRNDDGDWDSDDMQIRHIIDDWGNPLSYLTQRDWTPGAAGNPTVSDNHPDWNEASTEMIRLNGGQPVIMSYGPNGAEQLTKEYMEPPSGVCPASLVGDFECAGDHRHKIDHPLNADNIYAHEGLAEKLARGIP